MNWWAVKRKSHVSWLIAVGCLGVFVGTYFAKYVKWPYISTWPFLLISLVLMLVVILNRCRYLIPILVVGSVVFGLWRGSIAQNNLDEYKVYYGKSISISGTVKNDVDIGSSGQITIQLKNISINDKTMAGIIWITASGEDIKRGDILVVEGKLQEGFGNFSGVIYRAKIIKMARPQPEDLALVWRDGFADSINLAIPNPEASLGIGFLVGKQQSLPADLILALQAVGLTHIVVASGYNLTILVRLARRLLAKISKYLATLAAFAMIVGFILIAGLSPSMLRAGLVSGLSLLAWYYGRQFHPLVLLPLAIAITVIIEPSYAWGDLGWQLSFAAFAGVIILAPILQKYLFGDKKPKLIGQVLIETVSAQIMTAPIIIAAFGQFSNIAILSNLLVLPLVPLAMLLTFLAGVGGLLAPGVSWLIGLPAKWLMSYMIAVINFSASLPWAVTKFKPSGLLVGGYYLGVVLFCIYMQRKTHCLLREVNLVE